MRPALDPTCHRVPRTKPTCLLHTWRPHRQRPFALVLHLHQHETSHNLHLQYLAKNQSTQRCQSLITQGRDHPPILEPHMVLTMASTGRGATTRASTRTSTGTSDDRGRRRAEARPERWLERATSTPVPRTPPRARAAVIMKVIVA
jgi:hypothetical protein